MLPLVTELRCSRLSVPQLSGDLDRVETLGFAGKAPWLPPAATTAGHLFLSFRGDHLCPFSNGVPLLPAMVVTPGISSAHIA